MSTLTSATPVHVCIATGQNAANLIPLDQYDAQEIWILQTPAMKPGASDLAQALKRAGRRVERKDFDDGSPARIQAEAERLALQLDGRHVVLHVTGGTKLLVLALRDGLRLVEGGSGRLDIVYADTQRQQIDWLGERPRTEAMADVMDLQTMLQVQGYRIVGDNRHAAAQQSAQRRAAMTRELGDHASRYGKLFSVVAALASRAADGRSQRDLLQQLHYAPSGPLANLLTQAQTAELIHWDGDVNVNFRSADSAAYLAGGWLEEFVLLKLSGGLARPGRFSCNLQVASGDSVPNEVDAMVLHGNRALLVECKTGRQADKAADALYKLAQLRDKLCGSVGKALYLSAQEIGDEHRQRANEYRIDVLCADDLSGLVPYLRDWTSR